MRLADAQAGAGGAIHAHDLTWRSPAMGERRGEAHGLDMPFAFDTLDLGTAPMTGDDPPQSLAAAMHGAWVAFAATGDPG